MSVKRAFHICFILVLLSNWLFAQDRDFPYEFKKRDFLLLPLGLGMTMLGSSLCDNYKSITMEEIRLLDRNDVNGFDRSATYNWSPEWADRSDVSDRAVLKLKTILDKGHFEDTQVKDLAAKALKALEHSNKNSSVASERIAKIVANLKKFARLDEAEYQMAGINECVESAISMIEPEVSGRISIRREYSDLPRIYCSPSSLNQVFMALLKNSIEAISEKGEIAVRTFLRDDMITVEIIDNGHGISPDNLRSIFDVGYTTKGVKVGVGLGLSICYIIIVAEHKGNIEVTSELNKGTTVIITIPTDVECQDTGIA